MFKWLRVWRARRAVRRSLAGKTGGIFIYDSQQDKQILTEAVVPIGGKLTMVEVRQDESR